MPPLLTLGILTLSGFYVGRSMRRFKLPSIIGYMLTGLVCGPSLLGLLTPQLQEELSFITELSLGFVALSIGLELNLNSLVSLGKSIAAIIVAESFAAFLAVAIATYLFAGDLALALVFGALAPASAPAGTVAVIRECQARGSLTKALYAVVGFDDGLAIVIFGFAAAFARMALQGVGGDAQASLLASLLVPAREILLSLAVGAAMAAILGVLGSRFEKSHNVLILIVATVFIACGLSAALHLSVMLTTMTVGMVMVNTRRGALVKGIEAQLSAIMPLFFVLFFSLAGAHLEIAALPSLGVLGIVYIAARTVGLIGGARLGSRFGRVEDKVRKWLGLGILSQAGVAIGLALIVVQDFRGLGAPVKAASGTMVPHGDYIGATVITTVTATSIFFEVVGPILTRVALTRAGEIGVAAQAAAAPAHSRPAEVMVQGEVQAQAS